MLLRKNISGWLFAAVIAQFAFASAYGQGEADTVNREAPEGQMEEIVVIGIRGAFEQAVNLKREAAEFVDAVSAEDIGKLPDQNIAEALGRVPGVSIQRNRGEGDFVSVRGLGPEFVRGTLNGRTVVSGTEGNNFTRNGNLETSNGRETNFDLLPSELISVLEVFKSPAAEHVEGGMGGVVNVKTRRPLDIGQFSAASVSGVYRDFNDKFDPNFSGLYSWTNADRETGLLVAVAYSGRSIREDNADSWGYAPLNWWLGSIDLDADGAVDLDGGKFLTATASNPESYSENRERTTLSGTLQHRFGNNSELTADLLYSQREIENSGAVVAASPYGWTGVGPGIIGTAGEPLVNEDESVQAPDMKVGSETVTGYTMRTGIWTAHDQHDLDEELFSLGLNYGFEAQGWRHELDLIYSRAEGLLNFDRVGWGTKERVPFRVDLSGGAINMDLASGGPDLRDPSSYQTRGSDAIERVNDDRETALSWDTERPIAVGIAESLKLGLRLRSREKEKVDRTITGIPSEGLEASQIGGFRQVSGWRASAFPFGEVLFPDGLAGIHDYAMKNVPGIDFTPVYSPERSYLIEENTSAAYAQLDLQGNLQGIPFSGNIGVRVVRTDSDITGYQQPFRIENDEMNTVANQGTRITLSDRIESEVYSAEYTNVLPSLNLRFELTDRTLLRLSMSKSVTRPTFKDLSPGLVSVNETNREAVSGNPSLRAYESLNYDFGLEWYFADSSVAYASLFWKDITNFVGNGTETDPRHRDPASDGDGDGIPDGLGNSIVRFGVGFGSITQPFNQGEAEIFGAEVGYQHAFDSGFGYSVNATFIDSSAMFTAGANEGQEIEFEGVSDFSYNAIGYYEKGGFQVRVAYSYRDAFILDPDGIWGINRLYVDDYAQLDATLSYAFLDRYTAFLSFVNLNDEETRIYSTLEERPLSYSVVGRRYQFGVRVSF